MRRAACATIGLMCLSAVACARTPAPAASTALVPETSTMVTAWIVPQNPLEDAALDRSPMASQVRLGYRIFVDTPNAAPRYARARVTCANCHLNAGQRE